MGKLSLKTPGGLRIAMKIAGQVCWVTREPGRVYVEMANGKVREFGLTAGAQATGELEVTLWESTLPDSFAPKSA